MAFKPVTSGTPVPEGPLQLFDELPRMAGAVPELWRQQGDVLREYVRAFEQKPDVAIELPTGTGKTIVGLLLAEWRRRKYNKPVIYACPTNQLAYQVAAAAQREGIQAVTLLGTSTKWDAVRHTRYEAAEALGLTVYSHVFNASPKVGLPGTRRSTPTTARPASSAPVARPATNVLPWPSSSTSAMGCTVGLPPTNGPCCADGLTTRPPDGHRGQHGPV